MKRVLVAGAIPVRNGYVVGDIYFNPLYPKDTPHIIHSSTKSIMPALIGIAIEQGHIESVDVPVIEFFKDKELEITDSRMVEVTLDQDQIDVTEVSLTGSYAYSGQMQ